jgi:hypothetical protein
VIDDLALALRGTEILCGASLILQTIEFWFLRAPLNRGGVWDFAVQGADLAHAPLLMRRTIEAMSQPYAHACHLILRLLAAICMVTVGANLGLMVFLFIGTIILLIRWRGAFNGGSDFMTLVCLVGLVIATGMAAMGVGGLGARVGLTYIAIQAASSYFISGAVKIFEPGWRNGSALLIFLDDGLYGPLSADSLFRRPGIARLCALAFILWECSVALCLFDVRLMIGFCGVAALFHFLVFWYFGLNRFFFAWAASFPALIYLAASLS